MGKRQAALWLAAVMALTVTCRTMADTPFDPWSNVNGYWIAADGRSTIREALERGVTISKYQNRAGTINWKQMSVNDISFVMVRLGYADDQDPYFDVNMRSADSVGLKAGVLFYGDATSVETARKEAAHVLDVVKDYRVSYPIGYDVSSQYLRDQNLSKKQMTAIVNAFCKVVEDAGYQAVVFGDQDWLTKCVDVSEIPYSIWYNRYGMANSFPNRTLWRCTDSGQIPGIPGNVCIEFSFKKYGGSAEGNGWRIINGNTHYFSSYKMVKGTTVKIDGQYYYFDRDGISRGVR